MTNQNSPSMIVMAARQLEADRADYLEVLKEVGLTHAEKLAVTLNTADQIPMPPGLGDSIELRPSEIEGTGVFATRFIPARTVIAPARIRDKRTPAGRYCNHSMQPNAILVTTRDGGINLVALEDIQPGTEITVNYRRAREVALEANEKLK